MKLKTEFEFDAAHYLVGYKGKCSNIHGHRWRVVVWIEGTKLDELGILWDFTNTKKVENKLDHKCLNEVLDFNPTAENIATDIWQRFKIDRSDLEFRVRVYESPKSWAEVEG